VLPEALPNGGYPGCLVHQKPVVLSHGPSKGIEAEETKQAKAKPDD
jgi:hypothetical protein